ncbi:MAG: APC family permease [Candidatus Thermoplasmatota archaeon]|nr:APC family permease [Candidatus Thermoplasmatota archaeon]MCL5789778.1 APC family permease [Candidatus Thermoplasmatota archaeon]
MTQSKLHIGAIGLRNSLLQGVASAAPAGAAVATFTGAAFFARGALPLTALLAFFVVLLNAFIISRISLKVSGSGGYYEYVKAGHGPSVALFTGYMYIFYQIMAIGFVALSIAVFVPAALSYVFNVNISPIFVVPLLAVSLGYGFVVSVRGIRISTSYTMIMALIEIGVIIVMGIYVLVTHPSINTASVFTLKYSSSGLTGVALGVLLMYTSFAGFGASTPLGEETTKPKVSISKSVIYSVIILGIFYVFTAYVFTVAYGPTNMASYAGALVPGISIMGSYLGIGAAIIITVLFINSLLTGLVVLTNATSRVLMAMGRDGLAPKLLAKTHEKRMTPYVAAGVIAVSAFLISSVAAEILGGFTAFIFAAIGATLGTLFVHIIINSAFPSINKKFTGNYGVRNIALSVISITIFLFILGSTFIGVSSPVVIGTGAFIVWSGVIFVFMYAKRRKLKEMKAAAPAELSMETVGK